jgi:hypothetical protein
LEKERNFRDYEKIIKGIAYKFAPSMKYEEIEDLIQEGYLQYVILVNLEKIQKLNCPFEAALSVCITQYYLNVLKARKTQKRAAETISYEEIEYLIGKNPYIAFEEYFSLSDSLKEIIQTIYIAPKEFLALLKYGGGFIPNLTTYLKKYKKWSSEKIEKVLNEISFEIVE